MRRLVAALLALVPALAAQTDRITGSINPGTTVVLRGQIPGRVQAQNDLGLAGASLEMDNVILLIRPSTAQQSALDGLLASQQEPGSLNYHVWLKPEEFADRFGLSPSDAARIRTWLEAEGFTVNDVARGRHWIRFSGHAAEVSRAFHTEIHRYSSTGGIYYSNAAAPAIPAALDGIVAGIRGLNNFPLHRRYTSGATNTLSPDDYATIYDIKPLYAAGIDGTGQTIAIVGESDIKMSDISTFRQTFNLPPNNPQIILYGKDPGIVSIDELEADLDLEWSGAVAPGATILYVNSTDAFLSAQYAIDQNLAPVLSASFGDCELQDSSDSTAFRTVAQQANVQGITWMAAAGDAGAADCDPIGGSQAALGYSVDFPGSLPEVTSVGGTQFNENGGSYWVSSNNANGGSALGYIPEAVWNAGGVAAGGGGASVLFTKPDWQTGPGVPSDGARDVPDIVLSASAHDGYLIAENGVLSPRGGGTSASAPSFAGIVALLNHYLAVNGAAGGLGNINPMLYRMAQAAPNAFHDIVTGSNGVPCVQSSPGCVDGSIVGFAAAPGYDLASGLGSVDVYNLVSQWAANAGASSLTTLSSGATSLPANGSLTLTATVTSANGTGVPTGTVSFHTGDLPIATAVLDASSGTPTATATAYGADFNIGNEQITATYLGDSVFAGSSSTLPLAVSFQPNASAIVPVITDPITQSGNSWPYVIELVETGGTVTTLTDMVINGVDHAVDIIADFGTALIPANGKITAKLTLTGLTVPSTVNFSFSGVDASGQTWTQAGPVNVVGPVLQPGVTTSISPGTISQNVNASPSCQWSHLFSVTETAGFPLQITNVIQGTKNISSQIPQIFGSSRIPPLGDARAVICWSGIAAPETDSLEVDATLLDGGGTYKLKFSPSFTGPPAKPETLQISPAQITLTPNATGNASAMISVSFGGAPVAWTASKYPNNATTAWMGVSPTSGTGAKSITVSASTGGLSPGVYKGLLAVTAASAFPSTIDVPVVLVVGGSPSMSISGVANAASGLAQVAPGMTMSISGTGIAPGTQSTTASPLPLNMQGVSATMNGVSTPIFSVSPGLLTVQVPYEVGSGFVALGVNNNGQVASYTFQVVPAAPGIFTDGNGNLAPTASGKAGQTTSLFITGEGDIDTLLASGTTPGPNTAASKLPVPSQLVTVTVGGVQAVTSFVGITPGSIGQTQVTFSIPERLAAGPQPVVVTVGGVSSPPVNLTVSQ